MPEKPLNYFLEKKIEPSEKIEQVEICFTYLISSFDFCKRKILDSYEIAAKNFKYPCLLIIPGKSVGVDTIPANFKKLANNDLDAIKNYAKLKHKKIPCYLYSIDVTKKPTSNTPSAYQSKLIMIPKKALMCSDN